MGVKLNIRSNKTILYHCTLILLLTVITLKKKIFLLSHKIQAISRSYTITPKLIKCFILYFCRIRTERNGGAWCPKKQIARNVYEWLQIDLGELKMVTLVETQGRFGNGQVRGLLYEI